MTALRQARRRTRVRGGRPRSPARRPAALLASLQRSADVRIALRCVRVVRFGGSGGARKPRIVVKPV